MVQPEYSFEVGEKALYWAGKTWRKVRTHEDVGPLVFPVMEVRDPGFVVLKEARKHLHFEKSFWIVGLGTCYDPMRRQLDVDQPNFRITSDDVAGYLNDWDESIQIPPHASAEENVRYVLENPEECIKVDWIAEKIERLGPRFMNHIGLGFHTLRMSERFENGPTPEMAVQFSIEFLTGILDVAIPIIQKIEKAKLGETFPS